MSTENQTPAESTAVAARKDLTPAQRLKANLESRAEDFGKALAGRVDADAYLRAAYTAIAKQPTLLECSTPSLMMGVLEAASLGLAIGGTMGEAYLVAYNTRVKLPGGGEKWQKEAQLQPGYRGLVKLSRQSGMVRTIVPRVVYEGDAFSVEYGVHETISHQPNLDNEPNQAKIVRVYAVAHFADGTTQFEVMTKKQVDSIRARSKSAEKGPWVTDYTEMSLKTVVRRLCKRLPLSDFQLARALELDNAHFRSDDDLSQGPAGGAAGLAARMAAARNQDPEIEEAEYQVVEEETRNAA